MRRGRWISFLALVALVAGCAGPSTTIGNSTGTWHGSYWNLPIGNSYGDEADCTLRIKEDATFTASCTKVASGANNLARGSSWSGRVVTKGEHIVLQDNGGPWPSIVLRRSSDGRLYGTTLDPLVGATVEMELEREPHTSASRGGQ